LALCSPTFTLHATYGGSDLLILKTNSRKYGFQLFNIV
jgi:hypothetical protein